MQVYASSFAGFDRPSPPEYCLKVCGCTMLHVKWHYERYIGNDRAETVTVHVCVCPVCRRTVSVIPEGMQPRRSMGVRRLEELLDQALGVKEAPIPQPPTEKERESILRGRKTLTKRMPFLFNLFGQQLPVEAGADLPVFWQALRKLGSVAELLIRLARDFQTSLFYCYQSFKLPAVTWARAGP